MRRKFGKYVGICLFLALIAGLAPRVASAQNANSGELKGSVSDPSGALMPGVAVKITNDLTGVVTPTTTNQAGLYDVPFLAPGNYTITFSKQGFRDFVRSGIVLQITTLEIDATLQVGVSTQEIVVNAAPPLVETETSDQHLDIDAQAVSSAPITGTDWRGELTQLIPGVNPGLYGGSSAGGQGVGINGTQAYNMNFMIDGSAATAPRDYNSSNFYMPLDSMSEVSINSSNAPAQYGNGLAAINVITKSGTNQWHGDIFEYNQNTVFNARSVGNPAPEPKNVEHWNNYGGSVGGPILRDKLFFFFTYQRNPSATPVTGNYYYPTAAMQAGDFYGMPGMNAGFFDANGILQGTYSTVASNLQKSIQAISSSGWIAGCPGPANVGPTVAQTCNVAPGTNYNYIFNGSSPNRGTWYTGRVDYNLSSSQRLSFTFNYFPTLATFVPADPLYPNDASAIAQGNNYNLSGQLSHVWTISSNLVNEFRIGEARELDKYKPWSLGKNDPTSLGLEPAYGSNVPPDANLFPHITIDSGSTEYATALGAGTGNGNIDAILGDGTFNTSDVLTLVHGRHTIKVGGEYDRLYQNYTSWGDLDSGHFEFSGAYTGIPYADFLSGDVYSWHVQEYVPTSIHSWTSALFATDDFRISRNITLNLGLRWQMISGWGVKHNLFGIFDPNLPNSWNAGAFNGAILFGGQSDKAYGVSNLNTIENGVYKEFAPRVGIAWSPRPNWSVRASYGIFDAPRDADIYGGGNGGTLGLGLNPFSPYLGYSSSTPAFSLDVGPPASTVQYPTLATSTPEVENGGYIAFYPRSMPISYIQEFLFSVQHEFPGSVLLDSSYVYTRGTNLNFTTDWDAATESNLGCTGGWYACNPNPNFPYIAGMIYDGWSNYNALQFRVQKRMSYGLQFQANYAFSKSLDTGTSRGWGSGGVDVYQNAYSPLANYAASATDLRHFIAGQVLYELPFGRGRQHALNGVLDQIAGGWRVSSVLQWHTGLPFTPVIGDSTTESMLTPAMSICWSCTLFPVRVGSAAVSGQKAPGNWFSPAAFADPAAASFGDNLRNSLYGPSFFNMDFSIGKTFNITERFKLEFRADAYNFLNHVDYGNPDANVTYLCYPTSGAGTLPPCGAGYTLRLVDGAAGTISPTDVANSARVFQLGAKFFF
ncbi:MAG TPA: TonB-dependent receptor [Candidatus Acidoferrum sp.]|nr:TonB-dependent receptor [Candidatus Acidoferrum sp.]